MLARLDRLDRQTQISRAAYRIRLRVTVVDTGWEFDKIVKSYDCNNYPFPTHQKEKTRFDSYFEVAFGPFPPW